MPPMGGIPDCDSAKYLGFYLGPKAGERQWVAPISKFRNRAREIAGSGTPLGLVGPEFASRAVPVLGYVGQLVPPPKIFTMWNYMLPIKSLASL